MTTYYQQLNQYNRYCRYPQMLKRATVFGNPDLELNMKNNDQMRALQTELFDNMDPVGKKAITTYMESNPGWPHPMKMIELALKAGGGDNKLAEWLYSTIKNNPKYFDKYPDIDMTSLVPSVQKWVKAKSDMPLEGVFGPDGWIPWRGQAKELRGYLGYTDPEYDPDAELTEEEGEGVEAPTDTPAVENPGTPAVENPGTPPKGPNLANNYILPTALLAAPVALGGALSGNIGGGLLGAGLIGLAGLGYGRARQTGWEGWKPVEDAVNKMQNWDTMKEWNKALGIQTYLPPATTPPTQTPAPTTAPTTAPPTQTPPQTTAPPTAPAGNPPNSPDPNAQAWRAPRYGHPRTYSPGLGPAPQFASFPPPPKKSQGPAMNNNGPQFAYRPGPKPRNPFQPPNTQLWDERYV